MPVPLRNLRASLSLMRRSAPRAFYLIVAASVFAGLAPSAGVHVGARLVVNVCGVLLAAFCVHLAHAQAAAPLGEQEQRRRAQEQAIERERALEAPNVELQSSVGVEIDDGKVPVETPCFQVGKLTLQVPPGLSEAVEAAGARALSPRSELFTHRFR